MSPNTERIFARAYRPTIVVLCVATGSAWLLLLAIGKFTSMVDARAQAVVDRASAAPFAEHKDFRDHFARNDEAITSLVKVVAQTNSNVDRVLGMIEQQRVDARRGDIPVKTSGFPGVGR